MSKKLITACMALVALAAFALPAAASASPQITHPTGTLLNPGETGVSIKGTNIGETLLTDGNNNVLARCTVATMEGLLTTNTGTEIEGDIESSTFSGTGASVGGEPECTGTFGNITVDTNLGNGTPWCLKSGTSDTFSVRGNSCNLASRPITFVLTSTTVGACKYSRSTALEGTATTHSTGDATLSLASGTGTEFGKEEGGIFCPSAGRLQMSFTLETNTAEAKPLYIS